MKYKILIVKERNKFLSFLTGKELQITYKEISSGKTCVVYCSLKKINEVQNKIEAKVLYYKDYIYDLEDQEF